LYFLSSQNTLGRDSEEGRFLSNPPFLDRKRTRFIISGLALFFFMNADFILSKTMEDPMAQREEKVLAFRKERDRFFRENDHSPLKERDRKEFKGLPYYPFDLKYAMIGSIEKYAAEAGSHYITLPTNREAGRRYVKYGRFIFKWEGKGYVLQVFRPLGGGEWFVPFKDKTSGAETYSKGRYLPIEPLPDGRVLIDFNRAYNPFCQFNEKYTCPYAPEENWLDIAIRAGEKRFR
jgi:uncharacterized protein